MTKTDVETRQYRNAVSIPFADWRERCLKQKDLEKKEEFRVEAKRLFASLVQTIQFETEDPVLKTKPLHNEALSQLIFEMGPTLTTGSHVSRILALSSLCGAVEGCSSAGLSHSITQLLGNFLLEYCGPLEEDDDENLDEMVRDIAIACLTAVVRAPMEENETLSPKENLIVRLHLTQQGVQRRCAAPELDDGMNFDHGYDFPKTSPSNDFRGGLSTLPRSRRSLCFSLIRACVDGIDSYHFDIVAFDLTAELASFSSFSSNCLHGESDPRCLQQLLLTTHVLQRSFLPFFASDEGTIKFPVINIFDAVAPYYPIQFTPPPNDTNGITRRGLHLALMSVFSFTGLDDINGGRETMLNLSAGIFLERLVPSEDDDSTFEDKMESIDDLTALLFPTERDNIKRCSHLHEDILRELSVSMISIHAEASANVSSGGEKGQKNKKIADLCRGLVSKITADLECSNEDSLWNIFVSDVVRENSATLSTSPQTIQGRTTVAYLACLAASGGPKSLNVCLQYGLPHLIDALDPDSADEEKMAAAAYGIAAFYSSFCVCFERGTKTGVTFSPHPLKDFKTIEALLPLVVEGNVSVSTQVAAVRALGAVLLVTPPELIPEGNHSFVLMFLESLTSTVTAAEGSQTENELSLAASRTLSSIIGKCLENLSENDKKMPSVLDSVEIRQFAKDKVLAKILSHAAQIPPQRLIKCCQYDLLTLALACEESKEVSKFVVTNFLNNLGISLQTRGPSHHDSKSAAASLSFILERGGINAVTVFHCASDPDISALNILALLSSRQSTTDSIAPPMIGSLGQEMSTLELPSTQEEREAALESIRSAYEIIPYLLPAFDNYLPEMTLHELADRVGHLLPPLSECQYAQLCIVLPFLTTAIRREGQCSHDLEVKLVALFSSLLEFAFSRENDITARAAAASYLTSVVVMYQSNPAEDVVMESLNVLIFPSMVSILTEANMTLKDVTSAHLNASETFGEILDIVAMLGGAAACRGGSSTTTAETILELLLRLACIGHTILPFSSEKLDLTGVNNKSFQETCQLRASSAFGTMLSMEGGGQFWRQRLTHRAMKLLGELNGAISLVETTPSINSQAQSVVLCHIFLIGPIKSIKQDVMEKSTHQLITSLKFLFTKQNDESFVPLDHDTDMLSRRELHVATVLKLMASSSNMVSKHIPFLVSIFVRALSIYFVDGGPSTWSIQLLVLQGIMNATLFEEPRKQLIAMKPIVASALSTYQDHPCVSLRQAVVTAMNKWAVLK